MSTSLMGHFTDVGGDAKVSEHNAKDVEIQRLTSMLKAKDEDIDMLQQQAAKANEQFTTESDYRMRLERELDGALQQVEYMDRELTGKSYVIHDMSCEHKSQSEQLYKTEDQLEEQRMKNVELNKALNEKGAKLAKLQQSMARLGRNGERPMDDEISQKFNILKSDIMQFVRLLFSLCDGGSIFDEEDTVDEESTADEGDNEEELKELRARSWIAEEVYQRFFDLDALFRILGTSSRYGRVFEQRLRDSGCTGTLVSVWPSRILSSVC